MKDYIAGVSREFHNNAMSVAYVVMDGEKKVVDTMHIHISGDVVYLDQFFKKIVQDLEKKYECEVIIETYTDGIFEPAAQKFSRNQVVSIYDIIPVPPLPYNEHGHHKETLHVLVKPCPEFLNQLKALKRKP